MQDSAEACRDEGAEIMTPDVQLTVDRERVVLTNTGARAIAVVVNSEPVMALPPGAAYTIGTDWEAS